MTGALRLRATATVVPFLFAAFAFPAVATPYQEYVASLKRHAPDARVRAFVSECVGGVPGRPVQFYSSGGWFKTDDLAAQMSSQATNDDATAQVWTVRGKPRAVYQWTRDVEYDRDVLACLDEQGDVTRMVSRYIPRNEPDQKWIYFHTLSRAHGTGPLRSTGHFTDTRGMPMGKPHLTSEDQDFIAGERVYRKWSEFDFARLM